MLGVETVVKILLIGFGGFIGSVLRFLLSGLIQNISSSVSFPFGTLGVNVMGCFAIGIFSHMVETHSAFNPEIRVFLFIGILGAFTTYSTFGNETINLFRDSEHVLAVANIGLNLILCLVSVWIGRLTAFSIWG
jgi:CrcB protein